MTPTLTRMVMETEPKYGSPQAFLTWVHAVEPNKKHFLRSSVSTVVRGDHACSGHHWRVATIHLGAVRFLTVYSGDSIAQDVIWKRALRAGFLSDALVSGKVLDGWKLERSPFIPLDAVTDHHDELAKRLVAPIAPREDS